jgi:hypothetical protein
MQMSLDCACESTIFLIGEILHILTYLETFLPAPLSLGLEILPFVPRSYVGIF